jgi:repressor of nif and glnA expression
VDLVIAASADAAVIVGIHLAAGIVGILVIAGIVAIAALVESVDGVGIAVKTV